MARNCYFHNRGLVINKKCGSLPTQVQLSRQSYISHSPSPHLPPKSRNDVFSPLHRTNNNLLARNPPLNNRHQIPTVSKLHPGHPPKLTYPQPPHPATHSRSNSSRRIPLNESSLHSRHPNTWRNASRSHSFLQARYNHRSPHSRSNTRSNRC